MSVRTVCHFITVSVPLRSVIKLRFRFRYGKKLRFRFRNPKFEETTIVCLNRDGCPSCLEPMNVGSLHTAEVRWWGNAHQQHGVAGQPGRVTPTQGPSCLPPPAARVQGAAQEFQLSGQQLLVPPSRSQLSSASCGQSSGSSSRIPAVRWATFSPAHSRSQLSSASCAQSSGSSSRIPAVRWAAFDCSQE